MSKITNGDNLTLGTCYYPEHWPKTMWREDLERMKKILFYCKDMRNAFNIEVYRGMLAAAGQQDYMVVVNGTLDFRKVKGIMADGLILPNETIADLYLEATGNAAYDDQ